MVAGERFKQIRLWKLLKPFAGTNHKHWTFTAHHLVTVSFHFITMLYKQLTITLLHKLVSEFGYTILNSCMHVSQFYCRMEVNIIMIRMLLHTIARCIIEMHFTMNLAKSIDDNYRYKSNVWLNWN